MWSATVSDPLRGGELGIRGGRIPVVLYGARGFMMTSAEALLSPWPSAAYRSWPLYWVAPLGLGTSGLDAAWVTLTLPVALRSVLTASASLRENFWMMADFLRPVPASGLPTFWAMKTSSVGLYLRSHVSRQTSAGDGQNLPDDGLVEDGVLGRRGNEREGGVVANDGQELVVVDVERLGEEAVLSVSRGGPRSLQTHQRALSRRKSSEVPVSLLTLLAL